MSLRHPNMEMSDLQALQAIARRKSEQDVAMRLLFERHATRLMRHLRFRFNLAEALAEDLTAQTFLRAYEKAADFRRECEVASWLVKIARNLAVDYLRRENRMEALDEEDPTAEDTAFCQLAPASDNPQTQLAQKQVADCVRERFTTFRRQYPEAATALWERHVNDTSAQEIAPFLGREYGATRQFLSSWGKKLRAFVAPCYAMLERE